MNELVPQRTALLISHWRYVPKIFKNPFYEHMDSDHISPFL